MNLRPKVALTLVAVILPLTAAFGVYRVAVEQRVLLERFAERALTRAETRAIRRCERNPSRFEFRRRGLHVLAYDLDMRPLSPGSPPSPFQLSELDQSGPVHKRQWTGPSLGASAIRTTSGTCPVIVAHWYGRPGAGIAGRGVVFPVFLMGLLLLLTGAGIAWPLVRRIRRLTGAVERSSNSGYRIDAETEAADEIGELARAFDRAGERVAETIEKLEERDATLKEYVSNTTHDLAIPLTVLQHRLHRLRESFEADDERLELVDTALEESHYIGALVKNMNIATKLESGARDIERHATDLTELVERVMKRHEPIAENKSIAFYAATPDDGFTTACDSVLVEQALSNLVQNAVQYTARGGHVSVILEVFADTFRIVVKDDGPGIPAEMRSLVLERKIRGDDARSRNPGGQGFGLNIARKVCELHGWSLAFEDTEIGLTVVIEGANEK